MKSQGLKKFLEEVTLPSLETFLLTRKSTKQLTYTHTYMLKGAIVPESMKNGSWHIPNTDLDLFYEVYANELIKNESSTEKKYLCMTERHVLNYGPVIIDFDYKFTERPKGRSIDDKTMDYFVECLTKILKEMFGEGHNYMCVVLRRPHRYFNNVQKKYVDGLHIHFPEIVCEYKYQYLLREKFIKMNKIKIEGCDDSMETIYDKSVIKDTNWCLYGSTKVGIGAYDLYKTYNTMVDVDMLLASPMISRIKMFSIRNKSGYLIKPFQEIPDTLPKEISKKDVAAGTVNIQSSVDKIMKEKDVATGTVNIQSSVDKMMKEKDVLAQKYTQIDEKLMSRLNLLNSERAEDYKDWFSVCHIIRNSGGSFRLFVEFSKRSTEKYDYDMCINVWNKNKPDHTNKVTINKLNALCIEDNKEMYNKLLCSEGNTIQTLLNELYDMGGGSENNLAKIFYNLYPKLFMYDPVCRGSNKKEGTWLTYDEYGKYRICDGMQKAKQILSNEVHEIILNDFLNRLSMLTENLSENNEINEKQKQKIITGYKKKGELLLQKLKTQHLNAASSNK